MKKPPQARDGAGLGRRSQPLPLYPIFNTDLLTPVHALGLRCQLQEGCANGFALPADIYYAGDNEITSCLPKAVLQQAGKLNQVRWEMYSEP